MVLLKAIGNGAPFVLACAHAGICLDTFIDWRRRDPAFHAEVECAVADCALRRLQGVERHGKENFAALCWLLERRHPELFGRPEIQLNMISQNNTVENHLLIHITGTEATAIELQAQPVRDAVGEMFRQYRPTGNGEGRVHNIEATPVSEVVREPPPITHRGDSDAQNPLFWRTLVSSSPESKITKTTAVFVIRTLLLQTLGFKANRITVNFADDPVTLGDMFGLLEKLGGPAGWQLAQKLGA
jgi:hypothetical protein